MSGISVEWIDLTEHVSSPGTRRRCSGSFYDGMGYKKTGCFLFWGTVRFFMFDKTM